MASDATSGRREKVEFPFRIEELDRLERPAAGRYYFAYDSKLPGLALMVTGNGAKTFYVYKKHQGKPYQYRIGRYDNGSWKIEQARQEARRVIGLLATGTDPKAEKKKALAEPSFGELFTWWLDSYAKVHLKTWRGEQMRYERTLSHLENVKASAITKSMIAELHARLGKERGKHSANRTLELVRSVFNRAILMDRIKLANPAEGIPRFREEARARRINPSEMPVFLEAINQEPNQMFRDFFLLALLTGARKSNVQAMRWQDVDLTEGTWTIPGEQMKNGRAQTIKLHAAAWEILERRSTYIKGPWVFPGSGRKGHIRNTFPAWQRLIDRAAIKDLRIHDLRRTLGSWMVDTGASLALVGEALNHKTPGATQIYARAAIDPTTAVRDRAIDAMLISAPDKSDKQQHL